MLSINIEGHSRLRCHMYDKVKIGTADECTCVTGKMTAQDLLQDYYACENR